MLEEKWENDDLMKIEYWICQVEKIETILSYFSSLLISLRILGFISL